MKINNIDNLPMLKNNIVGSGNKDEKSADFSQFLKNAMGQVNELQQKSIMSNKMLASGKVENLHQVMIDSEKAEIALQATIQIRNKIMDAYNEIMRMPI